MGEITEHAYTVIDERTALVIRFTNPDQAKKYADFLHKTETRVEDPIPWAIADDEKVNVVVAPGWETLKQWVDRAKEQSVSLWEMKTVHSQTFDVGEYPIVNTDFQRIFRNVIFGLHKSHESEFFSGRLSALNYKKDSTGIYVCKRTKRAIIICEKKGTADEFPTRASTSHRTKWDPLREDLDGFKELIETVVSMFPPPKSDILPAEYTVFRELYNLDIRDIQELEDYIMRSPLFWTKDDRMRFISFMHYCHRKRLLLKLKLTKKNKNTDLENWHEKIKQVDPEKDSIHKVTLYKIFTYNKCRRDGQEDHIDGQYGGIQGNNAERYHRPQDVIPFIRNALEHYDQTAKTECDSYQVEEFIHVEFPDALPKIYLAMVRDIRGCSIPGQRKRFRHYLMSWFGKK